MGTDDKDLIQPPRRSRRAIIVWVSVSLAMSVSVLVVLACILLMGKTYQNPVTAALPSGATDIQYSNLTVDRDVVLFLSASVGRADFDAFAHKLGMEDPSVINGNEPEGSITARRPPWFHLWESGDAVTSGMVPRGVGTAHFHKGRMYFWGPT
jgi:hypothetical protein